MSSTRSKLTIDLGAIAQNWLTHAKHVFPSRCSAVVKADAYGLGVVEVSLALYQKGCRDFFVASLQEATQLRRMLSDDASIFILAGVFPGEERACFDAGFIPVIVSMEMLKRWTAVAQGKKNCAALKIDTGMGRLGLSMQELKASLQGELLQQAGVQLILSHLACADQSEHPLNKLQLQAFIEAQKLVRERFPSLKFSLANSAGCSLGAEYHFDMVRPGIALYGSLVRGPLVKKLKPVVNLSLDVIQVKEVPAGAPVGYGATSVADEARMIAVAAGGYADGISLALGNRGHGFVHGFSAPIAGRISMDSTMFDVTAFCNKRGELNNTEFIQPFPRIELLGENQGVDELALGAGTMAYEVLTALGERFERVYVGAAKQKPVRLSSASLSKVKNA